MVRMFIGEMVDDGFGGVGILCTNRYGVWWL